jgi:hypothetical protein
MSQDMTPVRADRWCAMGCETGWLYFANDEMPSPCPNCKPWLVKCRQCGAWDASRAPNGKGYPHQCLGRARVVVGTLAPADLRHELAVAKSAASLARKPAPRDHEPVTEANPT